MWQNVFTLSIKIIRVIYECKQTTGGVINEYSRIPGLKIYHSTALKQLQHECAHDE